MKLDLANFLYFLGFFKKAFANNLFCVMMQFVIGKIAKIYHKNFMVF
jgi:hypothetical protein